MDQLPFSIPEIYSGFAQADGVAAIVPEGLRLQFETRDGILGVFKSGVREVILPWSELAGVTLSNEFLGGATLRLRAMSLNAVSSIPGREGGEVVLKIARQHRKEAAEFTERLQVRVADQGVADVMERLRQMTSS